MVREEHLANCELSHAPQPYFFAWGVHLSLVYLITGTENWHSQLLQIFTPRSRCEQKPKKGV